MMQEGNNQPLPPKLDWDNVRDGIYDKIQSLESEYSTEKDKRPSKKRKSLFFILLLALILGLLFTYQKTRENSATEADGLVQSVNTGEDINKSKNPAVAGTISTTKKNITKLTKPAVEREYNNNRSSATTKLFTAVSSRYSGSMQESLVPASENPLPMRQLRAEIFSKRRKVSEPKNKLELQKRLRLLQQ